MAVTVVTAMRNNKMEKVLIMVARAAVAAITAGSENGGSGDNDNNQPQRHQKTNLPPAEMVTVGIKTEDKDAVTVVSDTDGGDNGENDEGRHSGEGGDDGSKGVDVGNDSGL